MVLDDGDWPDDKEYPIFGVVRYHAVRRSAFDWQIATEKSRFDSALIIVDNQETPLVPVFCSPLLTWLCFLVLSDDGTHFIV